MRYIGDNKHFQNIRNQIFKIICINVFMLVILMHSFLMNKKNLKKLGFYLNVFFKQIVTEEDEIM